MASTGALQALNHSLDSAVRPWLIWQGRRLSLFKICGFTGLALAVLLSLALVASRELPLWVMAVVILSAVLTFYGLAMATRIIIGEERLIYYHHEIAVILVAASVLALLGQPILPYLDATILGIGIFLVCGRVGCFMVGCCHGRPSNWGVRYREEHAREGFDSYLVGVRLLPIQLIESLWVLCIVAAGSIIVLTGWPPGSALALYVVAYDLGRFAFEFARGDVTRPYFAGFSEAQWISVALVLVVIWAEWAGILPFYAWHALVAAAMLLMMLGLALSRALRRTDAHLLLNPRHVREIAIAIDTIPDQPASGSPQSHIPVRRSSQGLQISSATLSERSGPIRCYSISHPDRTLSERAAVSLLKLIAQLGHQGEAYDIIVGEHSIYHLCIHPTIQAGLKGRRSTN